MIYTRKQLDNVRRSVQEARARGATRKEINALVASELVETNAEHLKGGDRDSTGILQQRPSAGWGPVGESIEKDVDQFIDHARQYRGKGLKAGELAQAVQRSAFPERYGQRLGEAKRLVRKVGGGAGGGGYLGGQPGRLVRGTAPRLVPGGETVDKKAALVQALLHHEKGGSLFDRYRYQVSTGAFTTTTAPHVEPGTPDKFTGGNVRAYGIKDGKKGPGKVTVAPDANRPGADLSPLLMHALDHLSAQAGFAVHVGTGTNHSQMTTSGNVSDHWDGHGADIPLTGDALTRRGRRALIAFGMSPAEARKAKGGIYNLQWKGHRVQVIFNTNEGGNHFNHLHIGIR